MSTSRKGITPEQLRQAAKDLNLTVAAISEGTGLSKAYISEFRNETRNLSASQQAQLRTYIEAQYAEQGRTFPDIDDSEDSVLKGVGSMVGMVKRVTRPAILLADDLPPGQVKKLTDLIEANRLEVGAILDREFVIGGLLGGEFSGDTERSIRELFALLALNYVAILMLQGRSIATKVDESADPKTIREWLSKYLSASSIADLLPANDDQSEEAA